MPTLTLTISEEVDSELARLALHQGVSKSSLIREAISAFLPAKLQSRKGSFLSLAEDLAGCVEGPEDLASHPRHLRSYPVEHKRSLRGILAGTRKRRVPPEEWG